MERLTLERYQRYRALIDDGKIRVGSSKHIQIIDYDLSIKRLSTRDRRIIRLYIKGWTHDLIAQSVGLSRSRVTEIINEFNQGDIRNVKAKAAKRTKKRKVLIAGE